MAQSILGPGMGVTAEIKAGPQTRHQLPALATCEISRRRDERTLIPAPPQHCRKFKAFTCRIFAIAAAICLTPLIAIGAEFRSQSPPSPPDFLSILKTIT